MNRYLLDTTRVEDYITGKRPAMSFIRVALNNARDDFRSGPCEGLFDWLVAREIDHHFTATVADGMPGSLRSLRCYLVIPNDADALLLRMRYNVQPSPHGIDPDEEQWMGVEYRILF